MSKKNEVGNAEREPDEKNETRSADYYSQSSGPDFARIFLGLAICALMLLAMKLFGF